MNRIITVNTQDYFTQEERKQQFKSTFRRMAWSRLLSSVKISDELDYYTYLLITGDILKLFEEQLRRRKLICSK